MPMSRAASRFSATARMDMPKTVRFTNSKSATMRRSEKAMMKIWV